MPPDALGPATPDTARAPDDAARRSRSLTLASLIALVVLGLAWELWLAPTGSGTLAIKVVPLLFAFPGVLRYRLVTYRWLSLAVWLYALEGSLRVVTDDGLSAVLAGVELLLSGLLFAGVSWHVRARLKAGHAQQADAP